MAYYQLKTIGLAIACAFTPLSACAAAAAPKMDQDQRSVIASLVAKLNENPDPLHTDITPAVLKLIDQGEPALPAALDLVLSDDYFTRVRARAVVHGIVAKLYGFELGKGWQKPGQEEERRKLVERLGDFDVDGSLESRKATVERWREWLRQRASRLTDDSPPVQKPAD